MEADAKWRFKERLKQITLSCLLVVLAFISFHGCATLPHLKTEHVVMVNGAGDLIDPRANVGDPVSGRHVLFKPYQKLENPREYFDRLFLSLAQAPVRPGEKKRRILLFVHGGLNTAQASIERVVEYSDKIREEGTYPIFINWDSSLTSSYLEHLAMLRQGRRIDDWCCGAFKEFGPGYEYAANGFGVIASVVTTPFYLAFDLVRGVVRLPVDIYGVYADLLSSHWRSVRTDGENDQDPWPDRDCTKDAHIGMTPRADRMLCEYRPPPSGQNAPVSVYPIAQGTDRRSAWESVKQSVLTALTLPVHIVSGLVIDMAGTGSWSSMRRRTTAMFNRDKDLWSPDPHAESTGGIATFMMQFRAFLSQHGGKDQWEVVLVGHSMGTIVANEMVRQFGHPLSKNSAEPLFDEIVYMAAACSLRDYLDTVPHYLEEYKTPRMYHLMLQDQAESTEQSFRISLPGSLLVWIDAFFSRPDSPLDLVAGRYQNLLRVIHLHDPVIRPRVSLKTFNFGEETEATNPQTHGDFGGFPFWNSEFWKAQGADPFHVQRVE